MSQTSEFIEKIRKCPQSEKAVFRKNLGKTLRKADQKALEMIYAYMPTNINRGDEDKYFACACVECYNRKHTTAHPAEIFARMAKESENQRTRFRKLLGIAWSKDGYLLVHLARFVRNAVQDGYAINTVQLLDDLLYWNASNQSVQKAWAQRFHASEH